MWLKLIRQICCSICQSGQVPKPQIKLLSTSSLVTLEDLNARHLKLMYPCLLDEGQLYYYTTIEDWNLLLHYIYEKFDMPNYIKARCDCEDFGILLKGLVSALFGLNAFGFAVGSMPLGFHGFNMFKTPGGWRLWEPNPSFNLGKPFKINDENQYTPFHILI